MVADSIPAEIIDLPLEEPVKAAWRRDGSPYPSAGTQFTTSEGSIRQFAAEKAVENGVSDVWAEFGVENRASAAFLLKFLPAAGQFHLFDSFKGLPEPWQGRPAGSHRAIHIPRFKDERVVLHKGWFEDTLPLEPVLGFVHIDCDLYSSTKTVLEGIKVVPGTIILFDELFGYDGWQDHEYKALNEWDREWRYVARDRLFRAVIEVL